MSKLLIALGITLALSQPITSTPMYAIEPPVEEPTVSEPITPTEPETPTNEPETPVVPETPTEPEPPIVSKDENGDLQFRNETMQRIWNILNEPLPIVGISILMIMSWVAIFIAKSSFGKKSIKKLNEGFARSEERNIQKEKDIDKKLKEYQKIVNGSIDERIEFIDYLVSICELNRNVKSQELKAQLLKRKAEYEKMKVGEKDGKENKGNKTTNNETTPKEI